MKKMEELKQKINDIVWGQNDGNLDQKVTALLSLFQSELKRERDFWLKELKWKGEK